MALNDDEVQVRGMLADQTADQPPAPTDRYRAVRQRVSRDRWSRSAQVLALALAITGVGLGVSLQASDSGRGPVTIRGILAVSRLSASLRTSCPPPSVGPGVPGNTRVTVQSPSGAVIGRAKLGFGTVGAAGISCDYPFTLKRVPAESRYRVSAGNGAMAWFTPGQVTGRIMLRLGFRTPMAALTGSDTAAGDGFGASLAMSGGLIVVGARGHARSAGRAYVFTRAAGGWRQSAELTGSDTVPGDKFGSSVAASDGTIVVGAEGLRISSNLDSGRAYAFSRTLGRWSQSAEMKGFPDLGVPIAVAVSGATIVVGSEQFPGRRTYIYVKTAGGWKRAARLDVPGPGVFVDAAMSATTIVITSSGPGCGSGQADVFTRTGHDWKLVDKLPGDGCFGASVAVSGSSVVVGGAAVPAAYVFTRAAGGWRQSAELTGPRGVGSDGFGYSVAISGQTVVVGSVRRGNGQVYVFRL
jgi:hypothetical protein